MPRTALDPRDLGVGIRDMLDLAKALEMFNWRKLDVEAIGIFYITAIEADHGFDDLHVSTSDGSVFRVQITRISSPTE